MEITMEIPNFDGDFLWALIGFHGDLLGFNDDLLGFISP